MTPNLAAFSCGWHALRYEGRGESLESIATLPTPIANRFGRATQCNVLAW
jgi:hypothetical protein